MSSKLQHRVVNAVLAALLPPVLLLAGLLTDGGARCLAGLLAFCVSVLYRPGRKLVKANLRVAFRDKGDAEIRALARENAFNTAWNWIDFLRILRHPATVERLVAEVDMPEPMPRQFLLCLPHLGSWELLAQFIPKLVGSCAAVAESFPYPVVNRILDRSRSMNGLEIIPRGGAVKGVVAAIRKGRNIGMLIDQNLSPRHGGIFVEFCGLPVPTSPLPAIMSIRYGLPILSGACIRRKDGRFKLTARMIDAGGEESPAALTQAILQANERLIREYPGQYTWLYRRWLYIPGDADDGTAAQFPYYAVRKKYKAGAK